MKRADKITEFEGKKVLITGGLGFIGSNLAISLVKSGAQVTLVDAMFEGLGGNIFNINPIKNQVTVNFSDIRSRDSLQYLVRHQDYIFHLAGQNNHVLSLTNPFLDIDINIKGTATLLEACRKYNPQVKLIYTGTRGEYGPVAHLPVKEDAPINPKGIYELSSWTAQKLFQIYHDNHGLRSVTLRLTNIYGERAQMSHDRFGVVNWFIRQAIDAGTIPVFGDGLLFRDFLYVGDAVQAILRCSVTPKAYGQVFNVGHEQVSNFIELAETIVKLAGRGRWTLVPFSPERAALEPGDYCSDITKIKDVVGWKPMVSLEKGIRKTIAFYRKYKNHYW